MIFIGKSEKLIGTLGANNGANNLVSYQWPLGKNLIPLNSLINQTLTLEHLGEIHCIACDKKIKKSFQQGYCFPCTQTLAQCDLCIIKPERCHFHLGTCRDPAFGKAHCFQNHIVYLANSSGLKVGITREKNIPGRWIDQGAVQALPILQAPNRRLSGLAEIALAKHISDKTDWRKMLKADPEPLDLLGLKQDLLKLLDHLEHREQYHLCFNQIITIQYPIHTYPNKITSLSLDKTPLIQSPLLGIKGQYLILESGVLNIRNLAGYQIKLSL